MTRLKASDSPLKFTRANTQFVGGATCQIWETSFIGNFNVPYDVQFAVGADDGLPRRVGVNSPDGRIEIRYWDWNSPLITVTAPD